MIERARKGDVDEARQRAWWWRRQGLDGALRGASPAEVLERCGWSRSVGGAGPYLTLHARAGTTRERADAAVAALEIHELPAARGCTYVVPASEFGLALAVGRAFTAAEMKTAAKLGVTEAEVEALCGAVLDALAGDALDPEGIRAATGDASRSLGEAGKKKGLTTTLPLALGRLQSAGEIRRVPVNGRLDQQRYRYARWHDGPSRRGDAVPDDAFTELGRRFFRWVGPATVAEFRWFSALGAKAARAALAPLGLVPADPDDDDRLLLPDDVGAYRACRAPDAPQYALVGSLDPIMANRRDVSSLLAPADRGRTFVVERGTAPGGTLADLPNHGILDRGRLIGLWDYDPDAQSIIWATFAPADDALTATVREVETFVRDELGDARAFSLDSPKSRAARLAALRAMAS